ncbi:MAG: hypothetical protein IH849_07840 [Acidobacteria bacterium]|nr:hypothetical protein [Acidobacteriota bacterium]
MIKRQLIALAITVAVLAPTAHGAAAVPAQKRAAREAFLRTAEVVDVQVVSVGITLPQRVELEQGGVRRSAMFKSMDLTDSRQIRIGQEVQEGLRDSWTFEIAAYELDNLLGLNLVPITVVRTIGDNEGALIDWVDDAMPEYGVSPEGFDMAAWEDEVAKVWLFDYLAYNIDRTPENLLLIPGFGVKLIDHSRAFQRFLVPMRPLMRFPRQAIDRLRALSEDEIRRSFSDYLTGEEIDALLIRTRRVLDRVDELLAAKPEDEVLF